MLCVGEMSSQYGLPAGVVAAVVVVVVVVAAIVVVIVILRRRRRLLKTKRLELSLSLLSSIHTDYAKGEHFGTVYGTSCYASYTGVNKCTYIPVQYTVCTYGMNRRNLSCFLLEKHKVYVSRQKQAFGATVCSLCDSSPTILTISL